MVDLEATKQTYNSVIVRQSIDSLLDDDRIGRHGLEHYAPLWANVIS